MQDMTDMENMGVMEDIRDMLSLFQSLLKVLRVGDTIQIIYNTKTDK